MQSKNNGHQQSAMNTLYSTTKTTKGTTKITTRSTEKKNKEAIKEYQRNYRLEQKVDERRRKNSSRRVTKEETAANEKMLQEIRYTRKNSCRTILQLNRPLGIEVLLTPFFKELKEYKLEMQKKPYSTILQCTITELKEHIESQFVEGMNWKNIDIAKKNQTYHFKNLYPVWMQNK